LFLKLISFAKDLQLCVLIDGLDECNIDSIQWLTSKLAGIDRQQSCQGLSVIVLSRYITNFAESECIVLDPDHDQQVSADVETFIRERVQSVSKKLRFSEDLHETIVRSLMRKSEGTFLWVSFVVDKLATETRRSRCEKIIHDLPKGLPAFYARMLKNIEPEDRMNSKVLLTWIALAFRKPSLETLAAILDYQSTHGISWEEAVSDEINICAPIIRQNGQVIDYVHQSAKDYMLRPDKDLDPDLEFFRLKAEDAHLLMAEQCLLALLRGSFLQYYALSNWPRHANKLSALATQLIRKADFFFADDSHARQAWWKKYSLNFRDVPNVMPPRLHIACYIGFEPWVRTLLSDSPSLEGDKKSGVDKQCPSGWSALDYAIHGNMENVVQLLLDHRAPSGVSEHLFDRYLERAALRGHVNIVRMLIASGIHPARTMYKACGDGEIDVVQSLVCSGIDLTCRINDRSYIERAAEMKRTKCLAYLLKNGANPNVSTRTDGPLLHTVARANNKEVLRLLLDHGARIDSIDSSGHTALHHTAEAGSEELLQILVERGADRKMKDLLGETAVDKLGKYIRSGKHPKLLLRHKRMIGRLLFHNAPVGRTARDLWVDLTASIYVDSQPTLPGALQPTDSDSDDEHKTPMVQDYNDIFEFFESEEALSLSSTRTGVVAEFSTVHPSFDY
jgi:ankyrin repeat protein